MPAPIVWPPPFPLGQRYLGYHVVRTWDGQVRSMELEFGEEGPDRMMVVTHRIQVSAECEGIITSDVPYLVFAVKERPDASQARQLAEGHQSEHPRVTPERDEAPTASNCRHRNESGAQVSHGQPL